MTYKDKKKRIAIDLDTYKIIQKLRKVSGLSSSDVVRIAINSLVSKANIDVEFRPNWFENFYNFIKLAYIFINEEHLLGTSSTKVTLSTYRRALTSAIKEIRDLDLLDRVKGHLYEIIKFMPFYFNNKHPVDNITIKIIDYLIKSEIKKIKEDLEINLESSKTLDNFYNINNFVNYKNKINLGFDLVKIGKTMYSSSSFVTLALGYSQDQVILDYVEKLNDKYGKYLLISGNYLIDHITIALGELKIIHDEFYDRYNQISISMKTRGEVVKIIKNYLLELLNNLDNNIIPEPRLNKYIMENIKNSNKIQEYYFNKLRLDYIKDVLSAPLSLDFVNKFNNFVREAKEKGKIVVAKNKWDSEKVLVLILDDEIDTFVKKLNLNPKFIEDFKDRPPYYYNIKHFDIDAFKFLD